MTENPVRLCLLPAVAALVALLPAQQAQFVPIPGTSTVPGSNPNFCGLSGSAGWSGVRVSADGRAVATVVYEPGPSNGAVDRRAARWTAATGTIAISPVLTGNYGVTGISADGEVVYGESWRWRSQSGYRSLLQQLTPGIFQSRLLFGCSYDGRIVTGVDGIYPGVADVFRWDIDNAAPIVLPRASAFPDGYFYFNAISGDGQVVGGATRRPTTSPFLPDTYGGVIVTPAGANVITAESEQCSVTSLSFDGAIAVGFVEEVGVVRSFRWDATNGLSYLDTLGGTGPGSDGSYARATNFDGTVVVGDYIDFGQPGTNAYWWTEDSGFVDLRAELIANYGLGQVLFGWRLLTATDVSLDGRVIVGQGVNPNGCEQAFLVRLPVVPARTIRYGAACSGPGGALELTAPGLPFVGEQLTAECTGAVAQALHFGLVGFGSQATPLSALSSLGQPGCDLLATIDVSTLLPVVGGLVRSSIAIPNDPVFAGLTVHQQVLQFDVANGAFSAIRSSNGLRSTIGSF